MPVPDRDRAAAAGRFGESAFAYDPAADRFICPAGQHLKPCGAKRDGGGKLNLRYASSRSACKACPLRARYLTEKGKRRELWRWEHADVIDRHRTRMAQGQGQTIMARRKSLVEHPFRTLKCRAGHRYFLLRGFDRVRGEWNLMALCYNWTRIISILGRQGLIVYLSSILAVFLAHLRRILDASSPQTAAHC